MKRALLLLPILVLGLQPAHAQSGVKLKLRYNHAKQAHHDILVQISRLRQQIKACDAELKPLIQEAKALRAPQEPGPPIQKAKPPRFRNQPTKASPASTWSTRRTSTRVASWRATSPSGGITRTTMRSRS